MAGRGKTDYTRRLKAFEMYANGLKKREIARELGVSAMTMTNWSRDDDWDGRLKALVQRSEEALAFEAGNVVAEAVKRLRDKLLLRLQELESICHSATSSPQARISAIKLWFELANKGQTLDPLARSDAPTNLALIEDLAGDAVVPKETLDAQEAR